MNYSYRLHPNVQDDFTEAYEWYEDQQKGLGERFMKAVRSKIDQITVSPEAYGGKGKKDLEKLLWSISLIR